MLQYQLFSEVLIRKLDGFQSDFLRDFSRDLFRVLYGLLFEIVFLENWKN